MKRSTVFALIAASTLGATATVAGAADLTHPTPTTTTEETRMPAGSEFSNGPAGGGATLGSTDHIPAGGEFSNGPVGGAANDPTPRRMPSTGEFSNGPAGISKQ
ncbi:MAG TPA: hypothetical protein VFE48_18475 [Methylomirabilota bacterium]|nr:hypothetical protein [Methylomirabilota bacterium]